MRPHKRNEREPSGIRSGRFLLLPLFPSLGYGESVSGDLSERFLRMWSAGFAPAASGGFCERL